MRHVGSWSDRYGYDSDIEATPAMRQVRCEAGPVLRRETGPAATPLCRRQYLSVLLTNAMNRPSGDHEGTLIVPWPP